MSFLIVILLLAVALIMLRKVDQTVRAGVVYRMSSGEGAPIFADRAQSPGKFWTFVAIQAAVGLAAMSLAIWRATHMEG